MLSPKNRVVKLQWSDSSGVPTYTGFLNLLLLSIRLNNCRQITVTCSAPNRHNIGHFGGENIVYMWSR